MPYSDLFAAIGTTHGTGDGSTTFNLPDCRGRMTAGRDNMGSVAAGRVTSATTTLDGKTLGATAGAQTHTLVAGEMPAHSHRRHSRLSSLAWGRARRPRR